jgi:NTE family protein
MNQVSSTDSLGKGAKRVLPFQGIVLVLQGGGALGAYQAGVFQAIHEANIGVDWICGTSIGAINGALIAGNLRGQRVERLREFWEAITQPAIRFPNVPWLSDLTWNGNRQARHWNNRMSAFATMFQGVPNFFSPRAFPPLNAAAESPDLVSYYDPSLLKKTLARLVNFDLINSKPMRLSVGATNVRTGAPIYNGSLVDFSRAL